jgi:hypothetical protein
LPGQRSFLRSGYLQKKQRQEMPKGEEPFS